MGALLDDQPPSDGPRRRRDRPLKLVRADPRNPDHRARLRSRLWREAQTLAQLAHPTSSPCTTSARTTTACSSRWSANHADLAMALEALATLELRTQHPERAVPPLEPPVTT